MRSAINKQDANIQKQQDTPIKTINYFTSSNNADADKRKSSEIMQIIHDKFGDVFNGIGCFKGTFSLQRKPDSSPIPGTPWACSICATKTLQRRSQMTADNGHHHPLGGG